MKRKSYFLKLACLITIIVFFAVLIFKFYPNKDLDMVNIEKLEKQVTVGKVFPMSDFLNIEGETICIVFPYHIEFMSNEPDSAVINKNLEAINYKISETDLAFLVFDRTKIPQILVKQTNLKLLAPHELKTIKALTPPDSFEPVICAKLDNAYISRIDYQNQSYYVIGKMK